MAIIYLLKCPITGDVRYIGKANDLEKRLQRHLNEARDMRAQYYRVRWIRTLANVSQAPLIAPLFRVDASMSWQTFEKFFIASAKAFGFPLTNATSGGEGIELTSLESLNRKRASHKKCWENPDYRKTIMEARATAEKRSGVKLRRSETANRLWANPEYIEKVSTAVRKAYSSNEARAAQSARTKAAWADPEKAAKRISSIMAAFDKPGALEARGKAVKDALARPDAKAKQSAASQSRWNDPEWRERRLQQMRSPEAKSRMKSSQSNPEVNLRRIASLNETRARRKREAAQKQI